MLHERRLHPRIRQRRKVGIVLSNGKVVYVWTYDLSKGGLQILSDYTADVGDQFDIFFWVHDGHNNHSAKVEACVRIVHVIYSGEAGCYRIGMQFVRFTGNGRGIYERFVDERLSQFLGRGPL